jgi:DNA/RNA-binding domain of Phe-tRNA-synthetase-like protein
MRKITFTASPQALDLGIKIVTARISGLTNKDSDQGFEAYKEHKLQAVKAQFGGRKYKDDDVLAGFRDLHTKVGRSNRDYPASPEVLRKQFLERDRFPHINLVVDIYNLVSLKTGLALGAHDINGIKGNVSLKLTSGNEVFVPLGKSEATSVFPGEYAYVDDENSIICRLEVLQVEPTKVSFDTSDIFLIIQGNANTDAQDITTAAQTVCNLITQYCGGRIEFLN